MLKPGIQMYIGLLVGSLYRIFDIIRQIWHTIYVSIRSTFCYFYYYFRVLCVCVDMV